jgi:hypothetical protein
MRFPAGIAACTGAAMLALALRPGLAPGQAPGDTGFEGTRFGATSAELLQHFGARATQLGRPLDFGDAYVDVVLRRHELGGYPFIVYFQMDKASRTLKRIHIERPRHGAVAMVHRAAVAALVAQYGEPTEWRRGEVVVRVVFREQSLGLLVPRKLGVDDWEVWEPLPEGLPQQLFVRIVPVDAASAGCGRY